MHIPDGFLDPISCAVTYVIFIVYAVFAFKKVSKTQISSERISAVTALAAAIFVAQMFNWPIPGGTSLHFVGGALAGIILGPYAGFVAIFLVLLVQCLVFHDGGITTLGANVINMAIIDVLIGYGIYKAVTKAGNYSKTARLVGAFLGGWIGITLAGIACGIEIGASPSFGFYLDVTVPVMGIWHAILGVIEGIITALVFGYVHTKAPSLIEGGGRA